MDRAVDAGRFSLRTADAHASRPERDPDGIVSAHEFRPFDQDAFGAPDAARSRALRGLALRFAQAHQAAALLARRNLVAKGGRGRPFLAAIGEEADPVEFGSPEPTVERVDVLLARGRSSDAEC